MKDEALWDEMSRLNNELVNVHRQLAQKNAELQGTIEQLAEYNHFVSHDIRAPLRAIRNYVEFLEHDLSGTLQGRQQQYLHGLKKAADQAHDLVVALTLLSRVHRHECRHASVDLRPLLQEVFTSLELASKGELTFATELPTINSDAALLRRIFENLFTNALKFNKSATPNITVGATREGRFWKCFVQDNGMGIDPRYHGQIFGTFERLHSDADFEGTGIGLAIVRRAVEHLGGTVTVDSALGQGSTFYVLLPDDSPRQSPNHDVADGNGT